jgi:hypothetical protein
MSQKRYLPQREADLGGFLTRFGNGIGTHGATLGLSPAEIADAQANCQLCSARRKL